MATDQKRVLRYPISEAKDNYKGRVFFQVVKDGEAPLQYQFIDDVTDPEGAFNGNNNAAVGQAPEELTDDACILYLPQAIQIADNVNYNNVELGNIGAFVEAGLAAGSSLSGSVWQGMVDEGKAMWDGLTTGASDAQARLAVQRVTDAWTKDGSGIAAAVKSNTRVTTNPNARAQFRSVEIRNFTFSFKLIAHSAVEAEEIKEIVKFFRTELYPSDIFAGPGKIRPSLGYRFPNRFRIEFLHVDPKTQQTQPIATKIKDCYLTSFNTVYNATSMGLHSDGNFTEIEITAGFREAATLTKADIQDGF